MTEHRDPSAQHLDSIQNWVEFLDVLDEWCDVTRRYLDVDSAPEFYSQSGRYGWWATILAEWILNNTNIDPAPVLNVTRAIQAKDPLGEWTGIATSPDEIERQLLAWRPYQHILVSLAKSEDEPRYGENESRDRWLYEQWQSKLARWEGILLEFKRIRTPKNWRAVSSINGIKSAAEKYATFHRLPFRKGTGGRPRKQK